MAKLGLALFVLCAISQDLVQGSSIEGRSLGGVAAVAGEFPWHVSLWTYGYHFCSGTLVSDQHVLTAAHCVAGRRADSVIVFTGSISLATFGEPHTVRTIWIHPIASSPSPANYVSDVAVLLLNAAIVESDLQRPLILPIEDVPVGASVVSSQWGRVLDASMPLTNLQRLSQVISSATECQTLWGGGGTILSTHLCAIPVNGSGVCNGGSGGALVYNNQVVGIVSWANPCALGYPIVYTRVYPHLFWIGNLVFNTETATTPAPPAGINHQASIAEGNYVLPILCVYAVARKLFFSE